MLQSLRRSANVEYQKLRRLFHIKDFATLIRPYVFLMSVLGYFPYSVSLSTHKLAKMNFVWSLILLIHITSLCLMLTYKTMFATEYLDFYMRLYCGSVYFLGLICLWTSYLSSRTKLHFLRMVSHATRLLSPETFCRTAKWMFTIDIIKISILISSVFMINYNLWSITYYMSSMYIFLVILTANSLFINSLYLVRLCFRKINASLEKLGTSLATDEPHLLRRVYHSRKNPALLSQLKTLRKQHLQLCKIVDTSNETFGVETIATILFIVIDITFNLYMYLIENTYDGKIVRVWSVHMEYLIQSCQSLIMMAVVCEMMKDQAKNIGYNIHRIHVITFDEEIITEVRKAGGRRPAFCRYRTN
nr:uncharacterized protein LOC117222524 [Megalopta genalis]